MRYLVPASIYCFQQLELSMVAYLQHTHEHQSDCNNKMQWEQVEKSFLQNEGDIGMAWSTKKEETRGHYTAKMHKAIYMTPSLFMAKLNVEERYRDGVM